MNKPLVYLAGPVSGIDPEITRYRFAGWQQKLEEQGFEVWNPFVQIPIIALGVDDLDLDNHNDCMRYCYMGLLMCSAVYLMPGWQDSIGANKERNIAKSVEIPVYYL